MSKALYCRVCGAIHSFPADGSVASCDCKPVLVQGWWFDPINGAARLHVTDPDKLEKGFILSLHSRVLLDAPRMVPKGYRDANGADHPITRPVEDGVWRQIHAQATVAPKLPEACTIFDLSRRACWAVLLVPGSTQDTAWATEAELRQKGLLREPARAR